MKNRISIILGLLMVSTLFMAWLNSNNSVNFRSDLKQKINRDLVSIDPIDYNSKIDVIYVLGGNQRSFEYKFRIVSRLFKKGICKNIWVLSREGITEYSPQLGRNWTNNEWTLMKLNKSGIPGSNVELVKVNEKFFGTLSEARDVSTLLKNRGYKSIMLIAQPYHTRRVRLCFNKYLFDKNITIYIQGSDENMLLRHLIFEFIKLKIYQYFLI